MRWRRLTGTVCTLAYFLAKNDVIDEKALATLR